MNTELVLVTGMSGSGKSVAIHALEDAGYYCVDNLPPTLLEALVALSQQSSYQRLAVAMDVRSATSLHLVPSLIGRLRQQGIALKVLFLDAQTDMLVRRFSETRRRHPLSAQGALFNKQALTESIETEREMLAPLRESADVIDTSLMRASQLLSYVKSLVKAPPSNLTLVFESFAFKRGIPVDADFMFDVRMLPNPYYDEDLRHLSGLDKAVGHYLTAQPEVQKMCDQIQSFLDDWLPAFMRDHRSYVTVAIGCTGGQHRSVYIVQKLTAHFEKQWVTLARHRELDGQVFQSTRF